MDQSENHAKLEAVAVALGGRLEAQDSCNGARGRIVLADGVQLGISTGGYGLKDRIEVYETYPRHEHAYGNETTTQLRNTTSRDFLSYSEVGMNSITMKADQIPEKIAASIERRYLTRYRGLYAQAVAFCEKRAAHHVNKAATTKAVDEALHGMRYTDGTPAASVSYYGELYADILVRGLSVEQVKKLAELVRGM